jgi:quercetin dioxygenase-like cupin family protein
VALDIHGDRESPEDRFASTETNFDVSREIEDLRAEPDWQRSHNAKTLIKRPDLRVVLVALNPGGRLDRHQAPGPITVHGLTGRLRVQVEQQSHELQPGHLLFIDAGIPHDVEALEASAFLLTIAWPRGQG